MCPPPDTTRHESHCTTTAFVYFWPTTDSNPHGNVRWLRSARAQAIAWRASERLAVGPVAADLTNIAAAALTGESGTQPTRVSYLALCTAPTGAVMIRVMSDGGTPASGQNLTVVPEKVREVGKYVYELAEALRSALDSAARMSLR
jgi:hypothetical protein